MHRLCRCAEPLPHSLAGKGVFYAVAKSDGCGMLVSGFVERFLLDSFRFVRYNN